MKSTLAPCLILFSLLVWGASPARAQYIEADLPSANPSSLPSSSEIDDSTGSLSEVSALDAVLPAGTILAEEGVLTPDDDLTFNDGSLYKEYAFDGEAGQSITITMTSDEFKTYLLLIGPDGGMLAQSGDISEATSNSEISMTLPVTGAYLVIANAYDDAGQGNYSITIRE